MSQSDKLNAIKTIYQARITPGIRGMLDELKRLSKVNVPRHKEGEHQDKYQNLAYDIAELIELDNEDIHELNYSVTEFIELLAGIEN